MKLLAIDTATAACSAALLVDGEITERSTTTEREHARLILPMIDELLAGSRCSAAQLDAVAFGCGPGSFTGVRIATGVAQGIGCATGVALVPVSDLAALAQQAVRRHDAQRTLACLDARMGELYWGLFERDAEGLVRLVGNERLTPPSAVEGAGAFAAGPGWAAYPELGPRLSPPAVDAAMLPQARDLLGLARRELAHGRGVAAGHALPTYLRDEVAWK